MNLPLIFCRTPYAGAQGEKLLKNSTKKLKLIISRPFILKSMYKTTKMSYYCNEKNRITGYSKSHVVYKFYFPAFNAGYIGKFRHLY